MKKGLFVIFITFLFRSSDAQIDSSFSYRHKLIPPEALVAFFPNLESGKSADSIDLRKVAFNKPIKIDSPVTNFSPDLGYTEEDKKNWFLKRFSLESEMNYGASASYSVIGKTRDGKFVVLASWSGGGTFITPNRMLVLIIKNDKLIKIDGFDAYENGNVPMELRGTELMCGKKKYNIK